MTGGCKLSDGEYGSIRRGELQIGESVNCDEGWMSGSGQKCCDLRGEGVTTDIGDGRRDAVGSFIGVSFGRSGTDSWFFFVGKGISGR